MSKNKNKPTIRYAWNIPPAFGLAVILIIGVLAQLLGMRVRCHWIRTGFFTLETFGIWLLLEGLAIAGNLIFAHGFDQSPTPLRVCGRIQNREWAPLSFSCWSQRGAELPSCLQFMP